MCQVVHRRMERPMLVFRKNRQNYKLKIKIKNKSFRHYPTYSTGCYPKDRKQMDKKNNENDLGTIRGVEEDHQQN